jgi:hypothetical protein
MFQSNLLTKNAALLAPTLQALRSAATEVFPVCASIIDKQLSETEQATLSFVNSQPFSEGSWYRPIHNLLVTMAMIRISESRGANRDLVLAAILHDVGYAALEIPGTLHGAAWDKRDVRVQHMAAGKEMSEEYLLQLTREGKLSISSQRLEKILEIIATHDNPYIGKPLSDSEALLHRDADRAFVLSCASFWKDYLALLTDPGQLRRFHGANVDATPEALLALRKASFQDDPSSPMRHLTTFEPMKSEYAQKLVQAQLELRSKEIPVFLSLIEEQQSAHVELKGAFARAIMTDFEIVMK